MVANNVALTMAYKKYASAVITPGVEPATGTDPGTSGGQYLRRVGSTFGLKKSNFKSNEIRPDMQIFDFRHGGKRVTGEYQCELSPLTFQDFWEAITRGTWVAALSKDQTVFTNITITGGGVTGTVAASTWAAQGFRVGDVVRFSNLSVAANNGVNTTLAALSGTAATFSPPLPADNALDATFSVALTGRKVQPPLTAPVARKFAFEDYFSDVDLSMLHTECRIGSMKITAPAEGICTVGIGVLGRNTVPLTTGTSPFFTAPTAATTTALLTTIGGQILVGGVSQGIVTAADLMLDLVPTALSVAGTPLAPEIFLGSLDVSGSMTALFNDMILVNDFINETEVEVQLMLATSNLGGADYVSFFMPRVKFGAADLAKSGMQGVPITLPFQALLKATTTGYDAATVTIQDSLSA